MLDISLLGPTEVRLSGVSVSLSPLERNLLAALALSKGVVISTDRIIDCLWGDRLPASPRSRVQGLVSSLRRKVGDALVTRHPGYLFEASGTAVDLDECENLAREARQATSPGKVARCLKQALGLWRGEPLDGVSAPGIEFDRVRLTELRVGLLEERFAAELELGHHAELVGELAALVSANPLRERLAGQLMLALYRCNRQADALKVYHALRDRLADELGSDPCIDLRGLHATILRGEPLPPTAIPPAATMPTVPAQSPVPGQSMLPQSPVPAQSMVSAQFTVPGLSMAPALPGWPATEVADVEPRPAQLAAHLPAQLPTQLPAQLPASVGHFTGRDAELAALSRAIRRPTDEPRPLVVSGAGGIGKTALVVRWAHSVADQFPDGQIFVDLHGRVARETLSARSGLGVALSALGVARPDIPATIDARASLYRTLISSRQVLIVADDAATVDQLLALVPPTTSSQLVATSRRRLVALAAHHAVQACHVEPLTSAATRDLLARIAGADRMREPASTTLVQWCGGWPLVTRLAGTRLAARPWQSMAGLVDELDELADQILDDDPRSVRGALVSAYASLSPAAAHLFGRLGLSASTSVSLHHPNAVADPSVRRVRQLLGELVMAHLLVEIGPDRYRIHDVVRRFARQCGAELVDRDTVDEWVRHRSASLPETTARMADSQRI